ncbi:ATP-binding protein [Actinomadura barringtoniae]|uniref:ATP-binding protein n=1 Tax=Actinomadura barringtoniae TaxID=1427535 RepID=A0A939TBV3_9ACTN|nr:ATP-binding protein [Actinomadura barringtoniae]MBO2453922.1 ATP-binding protein [Actinomadura barringtoniae]
MISSRFPSPLDSLASVAAHTAWPAQLDGEPEIVRRVLSPDLISCGVAREFTHRTLTQWNLLALHDDTALIASELVTNALRHASPPSAGSAARRPPQLVLIRHPRWLLAAVTDSSEQGPTVREPDYFAESGRGLHLIEALSDEWGWTPLATGGKVVWATLATVA